MRAAGGATSAVLPCFMWHADSSSLLPVGFVHRASRDALNRDTTSLNGRGRDSERQRIEQKLSQFLFCVIITI
jgi:hypothetical protein